MLREIRSDLKNYQKRVSFLSILTKSYILFQGGRFLLSYISMGSLQLLGFAGLLYGVNIDWLNRLFMTPRLRHYLKLT